MNTIAKRIVVTAILAVVLGHPLSTRAYEEYSATSAPNSPLLKWNALPVQWYVEDANGGGLTSQDLQAAASRAFNTWQGVATSSISAHFIGYTNAPPGQIDGLNVLGFLSQPDQPDTLAETTFNFDETTGLITEADIYFNSIFQWSVATGGQSGAFDLESIALHEIGHIWGLGHSAVGETNTVPGGRQVIATAAVMFPIAFSPGIVKGRVLQADDIAGISDLYPSSTFRAETGMVTGQVTKNGQPVYGAHIVAFSPSDGKLIGNFSDPSGNFTISGVTPGPVILRVEPVDDADLDSFFDTPSAIDTNFQIVYYNQFAIVPVGGSSLKVQIQVTPK